MDIVKSHIAYFLKIIYDKQDARGVEKRLRGKYLFATLIYLIWIIPAEESSIFVESIDAFLSKSVLFFL